jgi:septum formation protein
VSVPPAPPILLASVSPQRRAILEQLGLPFTVVAPRYEEHDSPDADPVELVREHARGKALSVGPQDERPVLGVDTAVVVDG